MGVGVIGAYPKVMVDVVPSPACHAPWQKAVLYISSLFLVPDGNVYMEVGSVTLDHIIFVAG